MRLYAKLSSPHSCYVLISVLAIAIILSSLYISFNSTAPPLPSLESSHKLNLPPLAPENFPAIQPPTIEILSPNLNDTAEADSGQCDSAASEGMEKLIEPEDNDATTPQAFKAYENLDLGIRFKY